MRFALVETIFILFLFVSVLSAGRSCYPRENNPLCLTGLRNVFFSFRIVATLVGSRRGGAGRAGSARLGS